MEDPHPRLLVTVRPQDDLRDALNAQLPEVPWGFLGSTPPGHRADVEAMLVGGLTQEAPEFDPASTPKLEFVQRLYTGVDGIPFSRFPGSVRFAGNVGAFAPYVAEHAVALALAAARDLWTGREMVRTGRLRPPPEQRLLRGATAVILGYGEIAREIARRLAPFDTRVCGLNRSGAPSPGAERMFAADHLREALSAGDFVFDVRPLTRRTSGSIGRAELEGMRPEAILVMVGRAATVDEEALYHHLVSHPRFRAAIDVWWQEEYESGQLPSRFPFAELPNVVGTPHSAGFAPGAPARVARLAVENLARYFRGGQPDHLVDRSEYPG